MPQQRTTGLPGYGLQQICSPFSGPELGAEAVAQRLDDPAPERRGVLARLRRLRRVEERQRGALERRRRLEPFVDLLDRPLRLREASLDDAGDVAPLVRQRVAGRQVDARDLEERDVDVADREVVAYGI